MGGVGGDLSGSHEIVVAVTVLGETHGTEPVTRADALVGDVIAVSGALGAAKAGYEQLSRGQRIDEEPIGLFVRPRPRVGAGIEGALHGATAMMDLSDGIVRDAPRIARASEVSMEINSAAVPIHPGVLHVAQQFGDPDLALEWALGGGEDHHMLATFPRESAVPANWHVIGGVGEGAPGLLIDGAAPRVAGWDHFR